MEKSPYRPEVSGAVHNEGEIDLVELFLNLWKGRWIILATMCFFIAVAWIYVMVAPPIYKLEATLAVPRAADISAIQPPIAERERDRYSVASFQPDEVFGMVKGYLRSDDVRLTVWAGHEGMSIKELRQNEGAFGGFQRFSENLAINEQKNKDVVTIALETVEPERDEQLINRLLDEINQSVVGEFVSRLKKSLAVQQQKLEEDIEYLRKASDLELQDEIKRLREAHKIASDIGLKETPYEQLANIELEVIGNLYLLGTKALKSQINALEARRGDDSFVLGLRSLQGRLETIQGDMRRIDERKSEAASFVQLKPVSYPAQPSGPKAAVILVVAVLVGFVVGVFVAFLQCMWGRMKERV